MVDISQLLAGAAQTNADWNALPNINKSYWEGLDQNFKGRQRDVFANGIPTNDDGSPNYAEAAKRFYQVGDINNANTMSNLDIQRQQLKLGQDASRALGGIESGNGQPPLNVPTVNPGSNAPPSMSRTASAVVAPPINQGRPQQAPTTPAVSSGAGNTATGPNSIVGIVGGLGIPDELAGPIIAQVSALAKTDPNAPLNPQLAPRIAQIAQAVVQRNQQAGAPQQAQPQAPPQQAPVDTRGTAPTTQDPNIQGRMAQYMQIMSNPALPQTVRDAAKSRLEALQKNSELTGNQKEYENAVRQGFKGTLQDFMAETEARKTGATEDAKLLATKYQTIVDAGVKAQQEIPQLEMLQGQMNDPNFYSGVGEKYNLMFKRLKSAAGIDPDAAVPQEFLRKATAAGVLASFGALKGLGPIRVAEMNLAKQAAAAPENSIPANKLLVEIQKRTYQRQGDIADMAQAYKERNGSLDAGFDKQVTAYFRANPIFNDAEIKDFHNAIGEAPATQGAAPQKFSSPSDVHAAVAAGKLKKGDQFLDPTGKTRVVP